MHSPNLHLELDFLEVSKVSINMNWWYLPWPFD